MRWTKTIQVVVRYPLLPIPAIPGHLADLVAAYRQLIQTSPTSLLNQPLITITTGACRQVVTVKMLSSALIMLDALSLDSSLYSLHSLHRGGATWAYRVGAQQLGIKCHGLWASDNFGVYVTTLAVCSAASSSQGLGDIPGSPRLLGPRSDCLLPVQEKLPPPYCVFPLVCLSLHFTGMAIADRLSMSQFSLLHYLYNLSHVHWLDHSS